MIKKGEQKFELRCCIKYNNYDRDKWTGEIYSRHGNSFNSFWYQNRSSKIPIQKNIERDLEIGHEYVFVYVKSKEKNIKTLRDRYIQLIGGQCHVQCNEHKKTLVVSYETDVNVDVVKRQSFAVVKIIVA